MLNSLLAPQTGDAKTKSIRDTITRPALPASIDNSVLAALPVKDFRRLLLGLEAVRLEFGTVLYQPGDIIRHVYFPVDALISLLTLADGRHPLEVGLVGSEGMLGVPLLLGHDASPVRALIQGSGEAWRIPAARFMKEFRLSPTLQKELYLYTYALLAQVSQTAGCNRFHVVEKRLARWLLMTQDRVKSDHFHLTHEFLGDMLGVRRVGVTKAAQALLKRSLISYSRGNILVLDRKGLEAAACQCYEVVRNLHEVHRREYKQAE